MLIDWWLGRVRCDSPVPDAVIAAFFVVLDTAVTLVGGSWWPVHPGPAAVVLLVAQAVACASLTFRRRAPLGVVGMFVAFCVALSLLAGPLAVITPAHDVAVWAPYATVLAAYAPVRWCASRRVAFVAIAVLTIVVSRPWQPSTLVITVGLLRTALGPLVAMYFIARQELVRALTDRAERAEREQRLLAEQARADERVRLAGEMHDVVTHRVSLMVLQAGALEVTASDDTTRRGAAELRTAGCQALDELRDLVGILRASDQHRAEAANEPANAADPAAAIRELVDRFVTAGVAVRLTEDGDPRAVSPVVGRVAGRVVAEALTNVVKHAPGAPVTVQASYRDGLRVSVHNRPATGDPLGELAATGSGLGIANLRERVAVVGGTLRAGPAPDGGFLLTATLPPFVRTDGPAAMGSR